MSTAKCIISDIVTFPKDKEVPILLNFQNGNLKVEASHNLHFTTALNTKTKEKEALLAVNGNVYHGCIKDRSPVDAVNTLIAVRNKRTNKVRLIQVRQASLVHSCYDEKEKQLTNHFNDGGVGLLIKNFGGRQANRNYDRRERMKMNVDVVTDQLKKTIDNTELLKEEEIVSANEERLDTIRPPFNKSAKKLEDIFSLYDIIPKELLDRLHEEAEAVLTTKTEDLPIESDYLKQRIEDIKLSSNPSSMQNLNAVKILIYMDALCQVVKLRERKLSKAVISKITEKVENDIRARFSHPDMPLMLNTSYTKDKAICYYIVLALLTSPRDYQVEMNVLMQELCTSRKDLIKFGNHVNASLRWKTDILCLKLPADITPLNTSNFRKRKH